MKATKEIMQGAFCELEKLDKKINELEKFLEENPDKEPLVERVASWIIQSWLIELELAKQSRQTLVDWMQELEFPI